MRNLHRRVRKKTVRSSRVFASRPESVLWSKDGGELPDIDRMIVEGQELTITTLNKTDNGTYRCEASNHLGSSSAEYLLFVYGEQSSERSHLFLSSGQ